MRCCAPSPVFPRTSCKPLSPASSPPSWYFSAALRPRHSIPSSMHWCGTQRTAACCEMPDGDFPEIIESEPELLAQHYAEAGLVEKSVVYWGKAGHGSVARSAMAEAAAQFQKGLDQLA